MAETVRLKAAGLSRYSDTLSKRPEGSLNVAENIVIDQDNIYSPRRGFQKLEGLLTEQATNIIPYSSKLLLYAKDSQNSYKVLYLFDPTDTGNEISELSGFTSSDSYVRYAESNGNIYFTGSDGVYKLGGVSESIVEAGVPEALPPKLALDSSGTMLPNNEQVRYRVLYGYTDSNNNEILGAPSNSVLINNASGAAKDVKVTLYFPDEMVSGHFYRVYRTSGASSSPTYIDPGDLCQLVYEAVYTSGTSVTITDTLSDDLRGVELYTNDTVEGIQKANYQPPKCSDMVLFNNHMFYANITFRQKFDLQLLTGSGFTIGASTVTIAGQVYTAAAAENLSNKQFLVNPASGSLSVDIGLVAESLCRCINANSSSTVYAYYDSAPEELPGRIRIEERDLGGSTFSNSSNVGTKFSPDLSVSTPAASRTSSAETKPNLLMYSKYQEPEAVPLLNYFEIGSRAYPIARIVALRDSVFVFKGDGIWRVTGTGESNFSVDAFDSSTKIIASRSLVVLNNLVFGLFDQGICQVSESGVSILSREIEGDIRGYIGSHYSSLANLSFGVAYETDRKYLLWLPSTAQDTYPTLGYVYNTITQAWTTFNRSAWSGVVNPNDDRLYIAPGEYLYISKERKDAEYTDFSDEQIEVTTSTVSGATLTIGDVDGVEVGDMYVESSTKFSRIITIDGGNIVVEEDLSWQSGSAEIRKHYESILEWNPVHLNSPGHMKQWYEALILCTKDFKSAELSFKTELDSGWETVDVYGNAIGNWGMFPWGDNPWGGGGEVITPHRVYIPRTKQRSSTLHMRLLIDTVYTDWEVSGTEVTYRDSGQRLLRR